MNAKNLNDAKLECSANSDCLMFDDKGGKGERFGWCDSTVEARVCPKGNILYIKGNQNILFFRTQKI